MNRSAVKWQPSLQTFPMEPLTMDHLIFHTVYDIERLTAKNSAIKPLEGIHFGNRLGVLYSQDGLERHVTRQGLLLLWWQ